MKRLLLILPFFVFNTLIAQERKIEKKVYNNYKEGKLDEALSELSELKEKYEQNAFYHYWNAFLYMEKLAEMKKRDDRVIYGQTFGSINIAKSSLDEAIKLLSESQLDIEKEEFDILFQGCSVALNAGDKKYSNYVNLVKQDFQKKKEYLDELNYNLSLTDLIYNYLKGDKTLEEYTKFMNEIKPRVKPNASRNELLGEIRESFFLELALQRNKKKLIELKKDNTDKNWVDYLKYNKDREYLSIVPDLEKMINDYYFNSLQTTIQNNKYNYAYLKTTKGNLDKDKGLLNSNLQSYANTKYGDIKFSNEFVKERNANYDKLISMIATKMKEFEDRKAAFENATYTENFFENFEVKANGWYESEDEGSINKISNGKFIFENKNDGGYINIAGKRVAAKNEGFSMSIQTTWVNGIDYKSFNMMWGANGFSSYYYFGISANGHYICANKMDDNYTTLIPWTSSEYINRNSTNVLSVKRNGNTLELYINYFKVNETPYGEFFGDQLGMIVFGKQRIEFDDLKIGITPYVEPVVEESEDAFLEEYIPEESLEDNDIVFHDGYGPGVKDIDGNNYETVFIGSQQWMAENLKVSKYNDGTKIQNVTDNEKWDNLTTGAWCNYHNKPSYNQKYGKLYNWYVIDRKTNGNKNVCPTGWHVPTFEEWNTMIDYLGPENAASQLKEQGNKNWFHTNQHSTNSTFFTALPGGERDLFGDFKMSTYTGYWWSSTEYSSVYYNDGRHAWSFRMGCEEKDVSKSKEATKDYGFSIRCIAD